MKQLGLFFIVILLFINAKPVKKFEGVIRYDIKYKGEQIESIASMMPTGYTYSLKDGDIVFKMEGGMMASMMGDMLSKGNTGDFYMIQHAQKKALRMQKDTQTADVKSKITKTDEFVTILKYKCQKYLVTNDNATQEMWVTKDIDIAKPKNKEAAKRIGGAFAEDLDGFPLKVIASTKEGFTIELIATEVKETNLDAKLFEIPKDYSVEDFDASKMNIFGK